jgi:hypothetical protein
MLKRCFIATLLGLFSPICAVFAATAPEIKVRWNRQVSFANKLEAQAFVARSYPGLTYSHPNEAGEKRLRLLIGKVDQAYRELFPALLKNKSFPDFVIFDSSDWTDLQVLNESDLSLDSNRGVLMVPSTFLKQLNAEVEAGVLSLLAHELAHFYLHHVSVSSFVLEARDSDGQKLSQERAQALSDFLDDSWTAGAEFAAGFAGLPFRTSILREDFKDLLTQLVKLHGEETCVIKSFNQYRFAMIPLFSNVFSDSEDRAIFKDDLQELAAAASIEGFQSELSNCSLKLRFKGGPLRKRTFYIRDKKFNSTEFIALRFGQSFQWKEQDEFAVLFELGKKIHADMRATYAAHRLQHVQWRSFEDEADDFAIAVMNKLGLRAEDFTGRLLEVLELSKSGSQMACRSAIAAQIEIPFGNITRPHHSICWRVNEFEKRFSAETGKSIQLLKSE